MVDKRERKRETGSSLNIIERDGTGDSRVGSSRLLKVASPTTMGLRVRSLLKLPLKAMLGIMISWQQEPVSMCVAHLTTREHENDQG